MTICLSFSHTLVPSSNAHVSKTGILSTRTTPQNLSFFESITNAKFPTKLLFTSRYSSTFRRTSQLSINKLPPNLQEIVELFQGVQNDKSKDRFVYFYGKNLKPLQLQYKTDDNRVEDCTFKIWIRAYLNSYSKNVVYEADSNSLYAKGLADLLVFGLSGQPIEIQLKGCGSLLSEKR